MASAPQTANRYSYATNNPFRYSDPSGRFIQAAIDNPGEVLGFALSIPVLPGLALAMWGAITGSDPLTGRTLSSEERSFGVLLAAAGPLGKLFKAGARVLGDTLGPIIRGLRALPGEGLGALRGLGGRLGAIIRGLRGGADDAVEGVTRGLGRTDDVVIEAERAAGGAGTVTREGVDLYRAVGVREYDSVTSSGRFTSPGGFSLEGRQFARTLDEALPTRTRIRARWQSCAHESIRRYLITSTTRERSTRQYSRAASTPFNPANKVGSSTRACTVLSMSTRSSERPARIRFLTTNEGGRLSAPLSGVRSQLEIGAFLTSCILSRVDENPEFTLGEEVDVRIALMFPDHVEASAFPEIRNVRLLEGNKLVATGQFTDHSPAEN